MSMPPWKASRSPNSSFSRRASMSLALRLDRVEDVDSQLDQLGDQPVDRAVAVVHHRDAAACAELDEPRMVRPDLGPPGLRRHHQRVLGRDVVVEIDDVEPVAERGREHAAGSRRGLGHAGHDERGISGLTTRSISSSCMPRSCQAISKTSRCGTAGGTRRVRRARRRARAGGRSPTSRAPARDGAPGRSPRLGAFSGKEASSS